MDYVDRVDHHAVNLSLGEVSNWFKDISLWQRGGCEAVFDSGVLAPSILGYSTFILRDTLSLEYNFRSEFLLNVGGIKYCTGFVLASILRTLYLGTQGPDF